MKGRTMPAKKNTHSPGAGLKVIVLLGGLLFLALTVDKWSWALAHWNDDIAPTPIGIVQRITFVASVGVLTQIDTEHTSVLVRGASHFQRGDVLERRHSTWGAQACVIATQRCEDLVGN
jgi:hypothetical protein